MPVQIKTLQLRFEKFDGSGENFVPSIYRQHAGNVQAAGSAADHLLAFHGNAGQFILVLDSP
jgi:hypothetical protein